MIDVNMDVYQIFEMTGFTDILKVEKKIREIDLSELVCIGEGMYGAVYRVDDEQIIKVFYGLNSRQLLEANIRNVRAAFTKGIPTIMSFDIVKTKKGYGQVFELLNSSCMSDDIHNNPQRIGDYAKDISALLHKLASTHFEDNILKDRNEMLRTEILSSKQFLSQDEMEYLISCINVVPVRDTAVHGDFHARNIMMLGDQPILIDMDDFSAGHPVWDIACIYRIYQYLVNLDPKVGQDLLDIPRGVSYPDFYYRIIGLDLDESARLWDLLIRDYFKEYSENVIKRFTDVFAFYSDFMVIRFILELVFTMI